MRCELGHDAGAAEDYLLGRMHDEARDVYEGHLFDCEACAANLEALARIRHGLERGPATRPEPEPSRSSWWALTGPLRAAWAAAALLMVAVGVAIWLRSGTPMRGGFAPRTGATGASQPVPPVAGSSGRGEAGPVAIAWASLAEIRPAGWEEPVLRDGRSEAVRRYHAAMRLYAKGDYAAAAPALEAVVALDETAAGPSFFLGVSLLLLDSPDKAVVALRHVIALGDSPYLEEALLYLARAQLLRAEPEAALRELDEVIRLQGDFAGEAQSLRDRIRVAQSGGVP